MNVLIAEDDVTSRSMLKAVLQKAGYDVMEACDGLKAWKLIQSGVIFDCIILDWIMPEMSGLEIIEKVCQLEHDIPPYIIMLTSKSTSTDIITALDRGANDYLIKPFNHYELIARLRVGARTIAIQKKLLDKNKQLEDTVEHVKVLQGILPICSFCKKIRNDKGYWNQLESYLCKHTDVLFSHGVCPECAEKHYSDYLD